MVRKSLIFLLFLIFSSICFADTRTDQPGVLFGDINGTNAGRYRSVKFSNGATTNNGDGSISITTGGGGSSQWTTSGSNIYYNTGNVGIGSTLPGATLDVQGSERLSSSLTVNASSYLIGNVGIGGNIAPAYALDVNGGMHTTAGIQDDYSLVVSGTTQLDNVGIGIAAPSGSYKLDVSGAMNANQYYISGSPGATGSGCTSVDASNGIVTNCGSSGGGGGFSGTLNLTNSSGSSCTADFTNGLLQSSSC